jgi:hypothetical protein
MKITLSYKTSMQISPDDFSSYTKVEHCDENENLKELFDRITKEWNGTKRFDCEIHFEV